METPKTIIGIVTDPNLDSGVVYLRSDTGILSLKELLEAAECEEGDTVEITIRCVKKKES